MIAYDVMPPEGECASPDGHERIVEMTFESAIPESVMCPRCGKEWTIVTFDLADKGDGE